MTAQANALNHHRPRTYEGVAAQLNVSTKNCSTGHMAVRTDLTPMVYASASVDQGIGAQCRASLNHSPRHDLHTFADKDICSNPGKRVNQGWKYIASLRVSVEDTLSWFRRLDKANAIEMVSLNQSHLHTLEEFV